MQLSVYTLACPEYTFETAAAKLAELGIPAVEWRVAPVADEIVFDPRDPGRFWGANRATIPAADLEAGAQEAAKVTADHGLTVSFLAGGPRPIELEEIRR